MTGLSDFDEMVASETWLRLGEIAERTRYPIWKLRRVLDAGLPDVRVHRLQGNFRVIPESDLPALLAGMRELYGPPPPAGRSTMRRCF